MKGSRKQPSSVQLSRTSGTLFPRRKGQTFVYREFTGQIALINDLGLWEPIGFCPPSIQFLHQADTRVKGSH